MICVDLSFIDRGQTIFLILKFFFFSYLKEDTSGDLRAGIPLASIPRVSCAPWKGLGIGLSLFHPAHSDSWESSGGQWEHGKCILNGWMDG